MMEREEAKEWCEKGHKIKHISFNDDEYIYYKNGKFLFENNEEVDSDWFGHMNYKWNWSLFY